MDKIYRLYYEDGAMHYVCCSEMCDSIEEFIDYYITISDALEAFEEDEELGIIIDQKLTRGLYDIELDTDGEETEYVDIIVRI